MSSLQRLGAFDKAGTFDSFCELHTTMVGKVVVNWVVRDHDP